MYGAEESQGVTVRSPLYLISVTQACNLCGKENSVAAIATMNIDLPEDAHTEEFPEGDGYLLTYVESYPSEIMREILARHSNYESRFSQMMGEEYLMSICSCGGHYGDHYVHREIMDRAFRSPVSLNVERLPVEGAWEVDCSVGSSDSLGALLS